MGEVRLSLHALRALRLLLDGPLCGADIRKNFLVAPGTLYPILHRLEAIGWLKGEWEEIDPREAERPQRRIYQLTQLGDRKAKEALSGLALANDGGGT